MRPHLSKLLGTVLLVPAALVLAGLFDIGRAADPEAERIGRLIRQLGSEDFYLREQANKELEQLGEISLDGLRDAAAGSGDLEVRRRAREAIRRILAAACASVKDEMALVAVEEGGFVMGSPPAEVGRRPDEAEHRVRITRSFLLGTFEVTQQEYRRVMGDNPSRFQTNGSGRDKVAGADTSRFPVEQVTWYDALDFCNRLSEKHGYRPYYRLEDLERDNVAIIRATVRRLGGNGYRLPTEAEWEYACRAHSTGRFHFGSTTKQGLLNCKPLEVASGYGTSLKWPDLGRTAQVGTYPANLLGLHDLHGNVAEWCWDAYDEGYYGRSPREDPSGPEEGRHRVLRGGSWTVQEANCRSASRFSHLPGERQSYVGFRVARTPGPPDVAGK